jgi:hypothetical protein
LGIQPCSIGRIFLASPGSSADDNTKKFLQDFVDRFAHLVSRLAPAVQASAA